MGNWQIGANPSWHQAGSGYTPGGSSVSYRANSEMKNHLHSHSHLWGFKSVTDILFYNYVNTLHYCLKVSSKSHAGSTEYSPVDQSHKARFDFLSSFQLIPFKWSVGKNLNPYPLSHLSEQITLESSILARIPVWSKAASPPVCDLGNLPWCVIDEPSFSPRL